MSDSERAIEERVRAVEKEQTRQGLELDTIKSKVNETSHDVKLLLARENSRPEGLTWKQFGAGMLSMLLLGGALWATVNGLIDHSQAVVDLNKRMDQAEWKYGWAARVDRN